MTTNGFTSIYHDIEEAIILRDFSKRQRKIIDLILRLSWGCGKDTATIAHQKDFCCVGIAESHISNELNWLLTAKVIMANGTTYAINDHPEQWQVSRVKPYEPEKLTKLVSLNLNRTYQNGKNSDELTKTVSLNFPKQEVNTSQNSKFPTRKAATFKKDIKKEYKKYGGRDKFSKGELGHCTITTAEGIEDLLRQRRELETAPSMGDDK